MESVSETPLPPPPPPEILHEGLVGAEGVVSASNGAAEQFYINEADAASLASDR